MVTIIKTTWCILGDCDQAGCHHCFPVLNCSYNHDWCKEHGSCTELRKILVTGCAGFIGSHVCEALLKQGNIVLGIDNLNDYYKVDKKIENLEILCKYNNFEFRKEDICTTKCISEWQPELVCHLASMAGVRYSIQHPALYEQINIGGFIHILEECVKNNVQQIVYASSSSVYGLNKKIPFSEDDPIDTCNSPYACSKVAMEIFAKTYSQLYNISCIGLRFFTVYGPRGRPDMAPYKFLTAIKNNTPFEKYGDGTTSRDYTYIDDIVDGIIAALANNTHVKNGIYNLGNSSPVTLNEFIKTCEKVVGKQAIYNEQPLPLGDVPTTFADIIKARKDLGYNPKISLYVGLQKMYEYMLDGDSLL